MWSELLQVSLNRASHQTDSKKPSEVPEKAYNFIKKSFQHRLFPANIAKFLRAPILKNNCERLLLSHRYLVKRQTKHHTTSTEMDLLISPIENTLLKVRRLKLRFIKMWNKVFKSRLSTFCGRQPLTTLKGYGLLRRTISLQIF